MPDLFLPSLEVISEPLVKDEAVQQSTTAVFDLAEEFYDQRRSLLTVVNAQTGICEQEIEHADKPGVKLKVRAQKSNKIVHGTKIIFAKFAVVEGSLEMELLINRSFAHKYNLEDDPYIQMISSYFRSHLDTVAA